MSALRISAPDRAPTFIDLGPTPATPLRGSSLRGRLCVPETTVRWRDQDVRAAARVRAFRERHGGRKAVAK